MMSIFTRRSCETLDETERANQALNLPIETSLSDALPPNGDFLQLDHSKLRLLEAEIERMRATQLRDGRVSLDEQVFKDIRLVKYRAQELRDAIDAYDKDSVPIENRPDYDKERALLVIVVLSENIMNTDFRRRRDRRVQLRM